MRMTHRSAKPNVSIIFFPHRRFLWFLHCGSDIVFRRPSSPQEVTYQNIVNTQDRFPALWSLGGCHVMETPVYGTRSSLVEVCFDWPATHAFLCHRWICSTVFFYKYKIYSRSVVTSAFATDHSSVLSCSFSPPTLQCYRL